MKRTLQGRQLLCKGNKHGKGAFCDGFLGIGRYVDNGYSTCMSCRDVYGIDTDAILYNAFEAGCRRDYP